MTSFLNIFICTFTVLGNSMGDTISLKGHVGGEIQIRCSHLHAKDNVKYFCNEACLTEEDILIKSTGRLNTNTKGRFSLFDQGTGNFRVNISGLMKSDSGIYWCGVDRSLKDTFHKVILTVEEAPHTTSCTTQSLPDQSTSEGTEKSIERTELETSSTTTTTRHLTTTDTTDTSGNRQIIYISAGLICLVLISAICLIILIKQTNQRKAIKHKAGKAQPNWNKHTSQNPDAQKSTKTNQQKIIESSANQRSPASRRPHSDPSSTEYSNVTPHSHDALNYTTVNFASPSDDLNYSTVIFIRESDSHTNHPSGSLYSTVKPTDSSHSTEDANAVIYSTIRTARSPSCLR
ncbi:uncharacterized protein [Salminus brasiliensis]|uniref:uncharacterized protein isoform X1 n=1 Tax=Salminus brasiliensis TaxID=930266 RepID=UPI003B833E83